MTGWLRGVMGTALAGKGKNRVLQRGSGARVVMPMTVDVVEQGRRAVAVSTPMAVDVVGAMESWPGHEWVGLGHSGDSLSTRGERTDGGDDELRWINPEDAVERGRE